MGTKSFSVFFLLSLFTAVFCPIPLAAHVAKQCVYTKVTHVLGLLCNQQQYRPDDNQAEALHCRNTIIAE